MYILCLQVFVISVLLVKRLPPLYVAILYFSFKTIYIKQG